LAPLSDTHLTLVLLAFFSFMASLLVNYILLKFARTLGIRSKNADEVRWNPNHKPALGGISFFMILLFSFVVYFVINPGYQDNRWVILGFFLAVSLAFLMGLADDAFNTQPLLKFITQMVCSIILLYSGFYIRLFDNPLINYALTILWITGMMNSFNLLDNMDGITGSVALVLSVFFTVLSISLRQTESYVTFFNLSVAGAVIGFLVYNFHPSKMYMGDSGSQFLGLFLAAFGIQFCWNNGQVTGDGYITHENILLVLLVFLLPITDTTTVFINRIAAGNSPFVGGKDHTTHHLFFKGITEKRIALLFFSVSALACWIAYQIIFTHSTVFVVLGYLFVAIVGFSLYLNTIIRKK
jgi:UDP-GlcNAc:undecaprenyl-phosphate/decaprenyl-phosphate GlcNAc-1-phosphate transferase